MDQVKSIYDQEMRRRRLQEAMLQQPQGTQYTGGPYSRAIPYSPMQGLTSIAQALVAKQSMEGGEKRIEEAIRGQEEKRKRLAESVMKTYTGTPGTPEQPYQLPPEQQFDGEQIPGLKTAAVPAVPGDPRKAMLEAAASPETEKMAPLIAALEKASAKPGRSQFSKINPKDFTQDSVQKFEKTGDYNDLISVKQLGQHSKDYAAVKTVNTRTDQALKKIDWILDPKRKDEFELNFGGYNAYASSRLPQAQDMRVKINSTKSDLKAAGLEMIRSGGSIGTMTEKEWPIVEQMIDSIDLKMSEDAAREAFANIQQYMNRIRENANSAYSTEWQGTQFYKQPKKTETVKAPTDVPKDIWDAMTPEEQALWK